jgi:hypothetical protein
MISSERANEVLDKMVKDGEHKVFVPAEEIVQYIKDIEALTGQGVAYDAITEEGIDIFSLKLK